MSNFPPGVNSWDIPEAGCTIYDDEDNLTEAEKRLQRIKIFQRRKREIEFFEKLRKINKNKNN